MKHPRPVVVAVTTLCLLAAQPPQPARAAWPLFGPKAPVVEVDLPRPSCALAFRSFVRGNLRAFGEYRQQKREYREAVAAKIALTGAQKQAQAEVAIHARRMDAEERDAGGLILGAGTHNRIAEARTIEEVRAIQAEFEAQGQRQVETARQARLAREAEARRVAELERRRQAMLTAAQALAEKEKGGDEILRWANSAAARINPSIDFHEADRISAELLGRAETEVKRLTSARLAREAEERRLAALEKHRQELLASGRRYAVQEPGTPVMDWAVADAATIIREMQPTEAEQVKLRYQQRAQAEVARARSERRAREHRHDPGPQGSGPAIAASLVRVFGDAIALGSTQGIEKLPYLSGGEAALATALEKNPSLRRFAYEELQVARAYARVLASPAAQSSKETVRRERAIQGLRLRIETDLGLIREAAADGDLAELHRAILLRGQIRKANKPESFDGLIFKGVKMTRRLDPLQRERVLRDALRSEELAMAILGSNAGIDRIPSRPQPPRKPDTTLPSKPTFTKRKFSSRSAAMSYKRQAEAQIEEYKRKINRIKDAVEQYKRDVESYKRKHADWVKQVEKAQAQARHRQKSRVALTGYLANRLPDAPIAGRRQIVQYTKTAARKSSSSLSGGSRAQLVSATQTYNTLGPDMSDWFFFYYTQNPMWLIDRDIALIQTLMDSGISHRHEHDHDRQHLIQGYDPQGVIDAGQAGRELDRFEHQHHQDLQQLQQDIRDSLQGPMPEGGLDLSAPLFEPGQPGEHAPLGPVADPNDLGGVDLGLQEEAIDGSFQGGLDAAAGADLGASLGADLGGAMDFAAPDLSFDVDVSGVDLSNLDLGSVDLGSVDIGNVDFGGVDVGSFDVGSISVDMPSIDVSMPDISMPSFDTPSFDTPSFDTSSFDTGSSFDSGGSFGGGDF